MFREHPNGGLRHGGNVDLLAEFGVGLNDNSPNSFGLGVAFYLR